MILRVSGSVIDNAAVKINLNLITGLVKPSAGEVRVQGQTATGLDPHQVASLGIARTFQHIRLFETQSVLENVLAGCHLQGRSNVLGALTRSAAHTGQEEQAVSQAREALTLVDTSLLTREASLVRHLSYPDRRRVEVARAIATGAKLLLLDEATSGLDPVVRSEILDLLLEFIQDEEHAVLLSTHITSDLEHVADYVTFLHDGQDVFSESKDDLADSYGLLKCGKEDFARVDRALLLRTRQSRFECEALVRNRRAVMRAYPKLVVDRASIEDIMVFYGKGDPQ